MYGNIKLTKGAKVKFIFPQNYNYNYKILGLIDYKNGILLAIWSGFIFLVLNLLLKNLNLKIFLFIIFVLPIAIFSVTGVNGESIIDTSIYMSKFI